MRQDSEGTLRSKPVPLKSAAVKPAAFSLAAVKPAAFNILTLMPTTPNSEAVKPAAFSSAAVKRTAFSTLRWKTPLKSAAVKPAASNWVAIKRAAFQCNQPLEALRHTNITQNKNPADLQSLQVSPGRASMLQRCLHMERLKMLEATCVCPYGSQPGHLAANECVLDGQIATICEITTTKGGIKIAIQLSRETCGF